MQKYFLHIFIVVGLVVVGLAMVSAYRFMNIKSFGYIPQNSGNSKVHAPGNLVGDELPAPIATNGDGSISDPGSPTTPPVLGGKIKADVFTGTLQIVDTGCFADGECFVDVILGFAGAEEASGDSYFLILGRKDTFRVLNGQSNFRHTERLAET